MLAPTNYETDYMSPYCLLVYQRKESTIHKCHNLQNMSLLDIKSEHPTTISLSIHHIRTKARQPYHTLNYP